MKKLLPIITILVLLAPVYLSLAQEIAPPVEPGDVTQQPGILKGSVEETLRYGLSVAFKFIFYIAIMLAVIFYIWAGIIYIRGQHMTKEGGDVAKSRIIYGTIGLIVALISWGLVSWLASIIKTGTITK
ncbi:MAG: hypothetical protein ACP5JU_02415 [Minisyncoccia bacterium]